jgi:hypothetical protein
MSPTLTSDEYISLMWPSSVTSWHFYLFVSLSDLYLEKSSTPSRNTEQSTTNTKGTLDDKGLNGDIEGNADNTEIPKK